MAEPDTAADVKTKVDEKPSTADAAVSDDDDNDDSYAIPESADPEIKKDCKKRFHTVLDFCWISLRKFNIFRSVDLQEKLKF